MNPPDSTSACFARVRRLLAEGQPRQAAAALAALEPAAPGSTAAQIRALLQHRVDDALAGVVALPAVETAAWAGGSVLQADQGAPLPGISIVSACMNREDNLLKVLPSWLDAPVDEIVIVDWSSREPLWPRLAALRDPRLRVVRIDDEPRWVLTHAFNVGLRLARHERVYKLDADIEIRPGFFELNRFAQGEFVRGFWRTAVEAGRDDQRYVNGSFGAWKADLRAVGYYDERIQTYGWDDSDLYRRLAADRGLAGRLLALGSLEHLPQPEAQRTENQSIQTDRFLGRFAPTEHENLVNRFHLSGLPDWGAYFEAQDFAVEVDSPNHARGTRTTQPPRVDEAARAIGRTLAARMLAWWGNDSLRPLDSQLIASTDFGWLMAQLHAQGLSAEFARALAARNGIHLFRAGVGCFRDACHHTLALLLRHRGGASTPLLVLEDDGTAPDRASTGRDGVFRASPALMDHLERALEPEACDELGLLDETVCGRGAACTVWRIDARGLAATAERAAGQLRQQLGALVEPLAQPVSGTLFVTSMYDERNLTRLREYLACLVLNARAFERLVLHYEARTGLLPIVVQQMVSDGALPGPRLHLQPYDGRPTFEQLFESRALVPDGTLVAVANADVFMDGSLARLAHEMPDDVMCALSRRDVAADARSAPLIRLDNGSPNTFSADVWVVRTPFEPDFFLDYPIGSFHCDSFINHQISRSQRYRPANPCLDVRVFHVHDERFNSSQEKYLRDRPLIEARHSEEKRRNDGAEPLRGLPWCRLRDLDLLARRDAVITWRPRTITFDRSDGAVGFFDLVLAQATAQAMQGHWDVVVVLRVHAADIDSPLMRLATQMKSELGLWNLLFDAGPSTVDSVRLGVRVVALPATELASALADGGHAAVEALLQQRANWLQGDTVHQICANVGPPLDDGASIALWRALRQQQPEVMQGLQRWIEPLAPWSAVEMLARPVWKGLKSLAAAPAVPGPAPGVSFITSMFRGGRHVPGYLANVLAAAIEADGEVILVDANQGDHDAPAVEAFLREHEQARRRIQWLRPDQDPGLYACWRLGIEQARAPFVTNANLDDRRNPDHTRRLVELLRWRQDLAAASGRISAVRDRAEGGWFDLLPNELWFEDVDASEFGFEALYLVDADGSVRSRNVLHCMPVWRRDLHERFGWFDEERYGTSADWAFWLTVARAGGRFAFVPEASGRYLVNLQSHNRRNDADGSKERRIIAELIGVQQSHVVKQ